MRNYQWILDFEAFFFIMISEQLYYPNISVLMHTKISKLTLINKFLIHKEVYVLYELHFQCISELNDKSEHHNTNA